MADSHTPLHGPSGSNMGLGRLGQEEGHDFAHETRVRDDAIPPSSPGLTTFHRHGPGHGEDPLSSIPSLRRRETGRSEGDLLRIAIATPFTDNERRKERQVGHGTTVAILKDLISQDEEDKWERNGMRLVWQGRIVRDEEVLGEVIGKREPGQIHTLHLVARRAGGVSNSRPTPTARPIEQRVATSSSSMPPRQPLQPADRNVQALSDSVHYVLFITRHHLCRLLGTSPLGWYDVIPPPVVEQDVAKEAVMSVIRAFAVTRQDREEGWENWQTAFEDETKVVWNEDSRKQMQEEIKGLWSSRVGRHWSETDQGEQVQIELDGVPYKLNLPPLHMMAPRQIVHLTLYLRLTSLLPLLNGILATATVETTTAPTATSAQPPAVRVRQFGLRIHVSRAVVSHMFFGAIKIAIMLWMLTRQLKWSDVKFWIIAGGLAIWYIVDVMSVLRPGVVWGRDLNAQARQGAHPAGAAATPAQAPTDAPRHTAEAIRAGSATVTPRFVANTGNSILGMVPLVHLDTDSDQLLLSSRPARRASWLVTQFLLPVGLWFITLIPEWEFARARVIRRRERAMRTWVEELTDTQAAEEARRAETERSSEEPRDKPGGGLSDDAAPQQQAEARPPVYPEGLGFKARRYYERVVARGEGIDWEEEREAQRAMGVGEEDQEAGGLFRM